MPTEDFEDIPASYKTANGTEDTRILGTSAITNGFISTKVKLANTILMKNTKCG